MPKSKKTKVTERAPLLYGIGDPGLKRQAGIVDEEYHQKLKGSRGRRIFAEMAVNDATIAASLWIYEAICRTVNWSVEEADSASSDRVAAATLLDQCMRDMDRTWREIVAEYLTVVVFGWALFEPTYKIRRGPDYLERALRSNYTDGFYGWRDWGIRAQESLYNWEFDSEGKAVAMWQQPPSDFRLRCIPLDRAILFRIRGSKGNPEGTSMLRPLYPRYFDGKRLREIEGVGIERNVAGMPVMEVPAKIANAKQGTAEYTILRQWVNFVKKIRNDAYYGAVVPSEDLPNGNKSGYRFRLLSSSGRSFADTNTSVMRNAKEEAMGLGTEHMFLGTDRVGALATSSDKTDMLGYHIAALLDLAQDQTNTIAIPRLMKANGFAFDAFPTWNHGEVSRRAITEVFGAVSGAVSSGSLEPGDDIDKYLREQLDLRPRTGARLDDVAAGDAGDVVDEEAVNPQQLQLPLGDEGAPQPTDVVEIEEPPAPDLPYITIDDIAAQLGVSRNSVANALRSGKIPGNKIGSKWRVPRGDFESFMRGGGKA